MPDIGYTSAAGDDEANCTVIRGNTITMTEAGAASVTLTFRLKNNGVGTPNVKAGVFTSGGTLIAESSVRTDITTEGPYTLSGGGLSSFTPADATTYLIGVISSSVDIVVLYDNIVSPGGIQVQDQDSSVFGPPMAFSGFGPSLNDDRSTIGYMTYTAAGGGGSVGRPWQQTGAMGTMVSM